MNAQGFARLSRLIVLATAWIMLDNATVLADPLYTAIDLGTGSLTYGATPNGMGTVTGSNGLTYAFNPVQNYLPSQWSGTTNGVPTVEAAPTWDQWTYGNPNYAYSYSHMYAMNSQGLGVGINIYGVDGHLSNSEAIISQLQPNGTWGPAGALWSGSTTFDGSGAANLGISGVAANGQVLGYGAQPGYFEGTPINTMYLYDPKTQSVTNLTNLIDAIKWTNSTALPLGMDPNWFLQSPVGQLDNQGRILVQATRGVGQEFEPFDGVTQNLLLVPQGVSAAPLATPEPATCAIFATLIGGWMAQRWARSRGRS